MPRKSKINKEAEVLNSIVNRSGEGEDPVVKALLSEEFVQGSNTQATEIALALQQLIRGTNSMLDNQNKFAGQLEKLRQRMDEMDKTAEKWNSDRENFVQEVLDKAEKLRANGFEKDRIIAQGSQQFSEAITKARAEQAVERQKFHVEVERMPKVTVISAGELVMVQEQGQPRAKFMNEVVKIKDMKWVLPVGRPIEVPLVVAQVLEERRKLQAETAAREKLLSSNPESGVLNERWQEINRTFNSTTDNI